MILFQHLKAFSTLGNLNVLLIQLLLISIFLPNAVSELFNISSFYFNFPLKVMIVLLAGLIIIKKKDVCKLTPLAFLYFLFFSLYLSRFTLQFLYGSPELSKPLYTYWMWVVGLTILPTLALSTPTDFGKSIKWLRVIVPASLLLSLAIFMFCKSGQLIDPFGRSIYMGAVQCVTFNKTQMGFVISLCFCMFFPKENKNVAVWLGFLASGVLAVWSTFFIGSRAGVITCITILLLGIVWLTWVNKIRFWYTSMALSAKKSLYLSGALAFGSTFLFILILGLASSGYLDFLRVFDPTRYYFVVQSSDIFFRSFLFGAVSELPAYTYAPHNIFLEAAICLGVLGVLGVSFFLIQGYLAAFHCLVLRVDMGIHPVVIVPLSAFAFFSGAIWIHFMLWVFIAVAYTSIDETSNYEY